MSAEKLHRLADSYIPRFADTFERSAKGLRSKVTIEAVTEDMMGGLLFTPDVLYAAVDEMVIAKEARPEEPSQAYVDLLIESAELGGVNMDLDSPFVLTAAKKLTADLVTRVNRQTKAAIRQIIFEAIRDGDPPLVAQKTLRQTIGLTKRDALAVKRMAEVRPEKVERYRQKLIRHRAITIARTETMHASNLGQKVAWQQMAADGLLDTTRFRQQWLATDDDRLCPFCAPMDGQTVGLDEQFVSSQKGVLPSERVPYEGTAVEVPPLHVSCRCVLTADFGGG